MYVDPDGHWLVDAAYLVMDVVDFVKKPSLSKATWVVADAGSFVDPSGTASAGAHAAKGIHAVVRTVKEAHAVTAAVKGVYAAADVVKGMKAVHAVKEVAATALEIGAHGEKEGKAVAKTIKLTKETTEATHSAAKATHSAQTTHSTVNVIKDTHSVADVDVKVVKAEEKTAQEMKKANKKVSEVKTKSTPNTKRSDKTNIADPIAKPIHGNSLKTTKPADVYVIREQGTSKVLRFGETTQGYIKRGQQWARAFKKQGIDTYVQPLKTAIRKSEAKVLETKYIKTYEKAFGKKPPYNKNYH